MKKVVYCCEWCSEVLKGEIVKSSAHGEFCNFECYDEFLHEQFPYSMILADELDN